MNYSGLLAQQIEAIRQHEGQTAVDVLVERIEGGTSANALSKALTANGYPVSATTIKEQRRKEVRR